MNKPIFVDLAANPEDARIAEIGAAAMTKRMVVGFVTDDEDGKADRYIRKLQERFPGIQVIGRGKGPVAGAEWVKVGPPVD